MSYGRTAMPTPTQQFQPLPEQPQRTGPAGSTAQLLRGFEVMGRGWGMPSFPLQPVDGAPRGAHSPIGERPIEATHAGWVVRPSPGGERGPTLEA